MFSISFTVPIFSLCKANVLLKPEEDCSSYPEVKRICAISSQKHAKADRVIRLQRSESCFAFIWDFVRNLNGIPETLICLNKKLH